MAEMLAAAGCNVHVFAAAERQISEISNGYTVHRLVAFDPVTFREKVLPCFKAVHEKLHFDIIESAEIHGNAWEIKKAYPDLPLLVRMHAPNHLVESLKKMYTPITSKLRFWLGALRRGRWDPGYWRRYEKKKDPDFQFVQIANQITVPSEAMKEWAIKNWKLPPDQLEVIPNPFEPPPLLLDIPIANGYTHKTIIFFGRLNVLKGLVNGTKAMKKILKKYPDWKFKVIGDDGAGPVPGYTSMKSWMQQKLQPYLNRVIFYEGVSYEKLPCILTEGEIVLLPSLFESFSYTCIEAMAAGKIIVGSATGAMNELIRNGKTGMIVNPLSVHEIYKTISFLIENPDLATKMGRQAKIEICKNKKNELILEQTINLYHSLINE
jgi:glycosyltransferase involved in cell wall biosynthesis